MSNQQRIPLFPLGLVLLPQMPLPLHIFEERYKSMIAECIDQNKEFGIVYFNGTDIQAIGCTASIQKILKRYDDGRLDILTMGEKRFQISQMYDEKPYLEAKVTFFDDQLEANQAACQDLAENGMNLIEQFAEIAGVQVDYGFAEKMNVKSISFIIAGCEGFSYPEKQKFIEMSSTYERLKKAVGSLTKILDRTRLTAEIQRIIGGNGHMKQFPGVSPGSSDE
ncbi:MAG: LON peptidase substrate-binding domain-containing protein [Desulfobacterales bacterium]|jgi:Lon protease-like protein